MQVGITSFRFASCFIGSFSACHSYGLRTSLCAKFTLTSLPSSNLRLAEQVQSLSFFLPFLSPKRSAIELFLSLDLSFSPGFAGSAGTGPAPL